VKAEIVLANVDMAAKRRKKITSLTSVLISGLLTPIGKIFREALISKEPTKFVVKIRVNSRCNRFYQK